MFESKMAINAVARRKLSTHIKRCLICTRTLILIFFLLTPWAFIRFYLLTSLVFLLCIECFVRLTAILGCFNWACSLLPLGPWRAVFSPLLSAELFKCVIICFSRHYVISVAWWACWVSGTVLSVPWCIGEARTSYWLLVRWVCVCVCGYWTYSAGAQIVPAQLLHPAGCHETIQIGTPCNNTNCCCAHVEQRRCM